MAQSNMDFVKIGFCDADESYNPRLGVCPDRYSVDDDQNLDTFCAVCGVPLRVMVSENNEIILLLFCLTRISASGAAPRER
jgi:hypothetical protein